MKVTRILLTVCFIAVLTGVARADLVVHYRFDDPGNLAYDSSGNNKTAVVRNDSPPSYIETGMIGGAAGFDGTQGYQVQDYIFPDGGFTFAAWVKPSITGSIVVRAHGVSSGFTVSIASSEFRFWLYHSAGLYDTWVGGIVAPKLNQWQHIAMAYEPDGPKDANDDYTGTLKVYMNGVHTNTLNNAKYASTTWNDLNIGWHTSSTYYKGAIDELRVYNRTLSDEEIAIFAADIPIRAIAYYSFDDPNSLPYGLGTDDSGSGFDLTKYDANTNEPDFVDEGYFGGAASFNGTNQGLRSPNGIYNSSAFSVTAWVKPVAVGSIVIRTFSSARGFSMTTAVNEFRYWTQYTDESGGSVGFWHGGGVAPKLNEWQHIAMTFEPVSNKGNYVEGIMRVYLNGIETSSADDAKYSYGTSASLCIGRYGTSAYYNGIIDDVAVFDRVLSGAQIFGVATGQISPLNITHDTLISDINKDGITNLPDFSEFSKDWFGSSY